MKNLKSLKKKERKKSYNLRKFYHNTLLIKNLKVVNRMAKFNQGKHKHNSNLQDKLNHLLKHVRQLIKSLFMTMCKKEWILMSHLISLRVWVYLKLNKGFSQEVQSRETCLLKRKNKLRKTSKI